MAVRRTDRDSHGVADHVTVVALDVILRGLGAGGVGRLLIGGLGGKAVAVGRTDGHSLGLAHCVTVVALNVVLRRLRAGRVGRLLVGGLGGEAVAIGLADRDEFFVANCAADVALDVVGRGLGAGGSGSQHIGSRSAEAMLRDSLPHQQRRNIAAAGVDLIGIAQLAGHLRGRKLLRRDRRAAVGQAVTDALQVFNIKIVAIRKICSAARRDDRADAGVFFGIGNLARVVAVGNICRAVVAEAAGNTGNISKVIRAFRHAVAASDGAKVIAVAYRRCAAAISDNTGIISAAGYGSGIVAGSNGRAARVRHNAAGAAVVVFIGHVHIGRAVFNTSAVLVGNNAARVGLIAARARRHPHIAVDGQVAHRALVVAEQTQIGLTLAVEVLNDMAVAIENAGKVIAIILAHRRPKLVAKVNVIGQHGVGIVTAERVDLVSKPCQLFALGDQIVAGLALVVAGGLFRSDLVRLGQRLAVPAFLNVEGDVKGQRLVLNGEVGLGLGCALGLDNVVIRAGHEVVNAVFVGGHDLAVRVRNGNLRFAGAVGLGDVEGDRIGRDLRQVDGLHGVLGQIDLAGLRFVAVSADGVGVLALAEVINAVRRALRGAVCVLDHDRRIGRSKRKAQAVLHFFPDGVKGLVVGTIKGVFRLVLVVDGGAVARARPADEAVALTGEEVLADGFLFAVAELLRGHRAGAAVGIEVQLVSIDRPVGGVGHVAIDDRRGLQLVLAVVPAVKGVAGAGRRGDVGAADGRALLDQCSLGVDVAAVRVEGDRPAIRPVGIEGEAAVRGLRYLGVRRYQLAALGRRVPAVEDLRAVRRDGQRTVGEVGGGCAPLVLAERLAVDRAAGSAVVRPLEGVDLRRAAVVILRKLAAVGVPSYVINSLGIGGGNGRVRSGHGLELLVPLDALARDLDRRISDRGFVFHRAVGVSIVRAGDRTLADAPRQGVAVSGVVELEHQLGRSRAGNDIVLIVLVEGEALDLLCLCRHRSARLSLGFYSVDGLIIAARKFFKISFDLILHRGVGIQPSLPAQNWEPSRAIFPLRAQRRRQRGKFFCGLLGRVAGADIVRKGRVQIVAVGGAAIRDRILGISFRYQRTTEIAVYDLAAVIVTADTTNSVARGTAFKETTIEVTVGNNRIVGFIPTNNATVVIVAAITPCAAVIHRHTSGRKAHRAGVFTDKAAKRRIARIALLHRTAVNAATSQGRTRFQHADQTAGLFHAGHSDFLHADVGNRTLRRTSDRAGTGAVGVGHRRRIDNEVLHNCIRVKVGKHADIAVVLCNIDSHGMSVAIKGAVEFVARRAQRFGHRDISGQLVAAVHIGDLIEARDGDRLGSFLRRGHHWE